MKVPKGAMIGTVLTTTIKTVLMGTFVRPTRPGILGFTKFQFLGRELKRVDMNASRTNDGLFRASRCSSCRMRWPALLLSLRRFTFGAAAARIVFDVGNIGGQVMSSPSIVHSRSLTRRRSLGIVGLALVMPSGFCV